MIVKSHHSFHHPHLHPYITIILIILIIITILSDLIAALLGLRGFLFSPYATDQTDALCQSNSRGHPTSTADRATDGNSELVAIVNESLLPKKIVRCILVQCIVVMIRDA